MGHHYISQWHIRHFTNDKGLVHCFDKATGNHFSNIPRNILNENKLYVTSSNNHDQDIVERLFASAEGEHKQAFDQILEGDFSQEIRHIAADYIALCFSRMRHLQYDIDIKLKTVMPEILAEISNGEDQFVQAYLIHFPHLRDIQNKTLYRALYLTYRRIYEEFRDDILSEAMMVVHRYFTNSMRMFYHVAEWNWRLIEAGAEEEFILTDHPLATWGNRIEEFVFVFPCSKNNALIMDNSNAVFSDNYKLSTLNINLRLWEHSRFSVSSDRRYIERVIAHT